MGKRKHHGHYCRVCGEYKANEKFSGRGHAAHICKKCSGLSAEERNKLMSWDEEPDLDAVLDELFGKCSDSDMLSGECSDSNNQYILESEDEDWIPF